MSYSTPCLAILTPSSYLYTSTNNIQQFYVLPTLCIYVFCVDLRTNSHYFPIQLTGYYNPGAVCLLRGTDWIIT